MRFLLTILIAFGATSALATPMIRVTARADVSGPEVYLGDVAAIRGTNQVDRKRFSRISLGRSPAIGVTKQIPRSFIEARIREAGVGQSVRIRLPQRLKVRRKTRTIRGGELNGMVRSAVQSTMPHSMEEVAAIAVPLLPDLRVPEASRVRVAFMDGEDFEGAITAQVVVTDGKQKVLTRRVSVRMDLFVSAWGVKTEIRRGSRLSIDDLMELRMPQSKVSHDAIREPTFVDGATVRRKIMPGEAIREAWFKVPPLVERGERIRLIARRGDIRITAIGEALNAGSRGAFVRVRNMDSRKVVTGRVSAAGTVEMEF